MLKKTSSYIFIISCFFIIGCSGSKGNSSKDTSENEELQAAIKKNEELEAQLLKLAQEAEKKGTAKPPAVSVCDRTEKIQEIILFKVKKTDCSAVTDQDLLAIRTIKSEERLSSLVATDFSGLSSLVVLDIKVGFNASNLSADLFSEITSLEILFLYSASTVNLPSGLLSGLSSLEVINFNFSTRDIPVDLFSGLTVLKELTLDFGIRQTLPSGLLSGLSSLEVCDLDTYLDDIPADFFSGDFNNLREITLRSKNYPEGLFSNLPTLKSLDIYYETSKEEKQRIQAEVGEGVRVLLK